VGIHAATTANVATATAWTQRRLVFEHRPLGEVADEFNRYNRGEIQIQSPELRKQKSPGYSRRMTRIPSWTSSPRSQV